MGALALTVAFTSTAVAAIGDAKGPKCADIVDGSAFYPAFGHVTAEVTVAGPTCGNVTYTLWVAPASTDGALTGPYVATVGGTTSVDELGRGVIAFDYTFSGSPDAVCAYAETSLGKPIRDRGPDTGCDLILVGSTPGRAGWN
jgi:hypothetical protein